MVLYAGVWAVFGSALPAALATPAQATFLEDINYLIWRNGEDIGRHRVSFKTDDDKLIVEADAEIEIKAWFLTVYTFRQKVTETWKDGRLIRFVSRTDDDGRSYLVDGRAIEGGFIVSHKEGRIGGEYLAPENVVPASYWHPMTVRQQQLIDPKTGKLLRIKIKLSGKEPVQTTDGMVAARKFKVKGDVTATLWYDSKDRLTQAWYHAPEDGSLVKYQLGPFRTILGSIVP